MTRSLFDPTGDETERSGSTFTGPDAANISHVPANLTDGEVREQEVADAEGRAAADLDGEAGASGTDPSATTAGRTDDTSPELEDIADAADGTTPA